MISRLRALVNGRGLKRKASAGNGTRVFNRLRLGLTVLYLLATLGLLSIVGGGVYQFLKGYFQSNTDTALEHRMADEFHMLNLTIPDDLKAAASLDDGRGGRRGPDNSANQHGDNNQANNSPNSSDFDGDLLAVFTMQLDSNGNMLASQAPVAPIAPDKAATSAALANTSDWRTITLDTGQQARLFSYRVAGANGLAVLQLGRLLDDQNRVLSEILSSLYWLSGLSVLLVGAGAWWVAGRSLRPAEQAWQRQQAFVANASHELRTPLTLMRATAEVARRSLPGDVDEQDELLSDVLQECDHMARLVEDLLLLSRIDAGRLVIERQRLVVADVLTDVQRQVGRIAAGQGLRISVTGAEGAVMADPARLRQTLLILLDNALRHTPPGGAITLAASPRNRYIELTVADSGEGIPAADLGHVFERFYRADKARGVEGHSGLGLSIAKELIERQHGKITINSTVGQGTQVTLLLPTT